MADRPRRALRHMKTAWHPLLVVLLEHLLPREWYQLTPEFQLTKEPQRVDTVIVRRLRRRGKPPEPSHLASVLQGLRAHNLVHLKGPTDELEKHDATQLLGYAVQYVRVEDVADPRDVALRVIAPTLTPRFAEQVKRFDGSLAPTKRLGVHEGSLGVFPLRVVETAVAYPGENEHLLYTLAPQYVERPEDIPALDDEERMLFHFLSQCVEQFRKDPQWRTLMKDASRVDKSYADAFDKVLKALPLEKRLGLVTREELREGLPLKKRLGLVTQEEMREELTEGERVLLLSDEALRALSDEYIAKLPAGVRAKVRARRRG